jgi:hypothetical protein
MKLTDLKTSAFPRGSVWRRWDLHVHTPESKLGNSFAGVGWDEYLDMLEKSAKDSHISVLGVTDYMSIDGYEKILAVRQAGQPRLGSIDLVLPNIEFRANPPTADGKALNIHVLVDPAAPDHVNRIKRALKNLKVKYGEESYGCIRAELIEYAKAQDASLTDEDVAYRRGIEQFKPSYDTIVEWISNEGWLLQNSLMGVANGKDGISALPLDGFSAVREQLLKNCHFVFSGNAADRSHYLGKKAGFPPEEIRRLYRSLKPCLHGSDAHKPEELFKPKEDRYCWIKADPTFEGLRQVLWEPEARVHIGAAQPQAADASRVIESLEIRASNGWFPQHSIPLNPGLVAIIGEKGAGKTAVADLIAFAAGIPMDPSSQSSFVTKGRLHLRGTQIALRWQAGSPTSGTLADQPFKTQRPLVRYLSQDFVERLCSEDHNGKELQQAIEEVVFSHLDESFREGYSSFEELRASRESASQSRQDEFRGQLASLNREIERLNLSIAQRPSKEALRAQTERQIVELKKQLPSAESLADQEVLKKLELERTALALTQAELNDRSRQRRSIDDLQKAYFAVKERTGKQIQELVDALPKRTQIPKPVLEKLFPKWDGEVESELDSLLVSLDAEISSLTGNSAALTSDGKSIADTSARIASLQEVLSKDEVNKARLLELQKQIATQESTSTRLGKEIAELEGKVLKQLGHKEREREDLYSAFFSALSKDEVGLQELYAPMKKALVALGADVKFELSAGFRVDSAEWLQKADRFFDGRKPAALARKDAIEKYVVDTMSPAWKSGAVDRIGNAIRGLVSLVSPTEFLDKLASPSLKLLDLFDWLFSTDHVSVTYKIRYGGTELEFLSPGTRGIALLVLYLLMDEDDRRPLVVDQPEGNLDNSSIYLQLVPYIRKAKEKRQIILVTHNPNLVVATDAEQVVVAVAERTVGQVTPRITYVPGSLEHSSKDAASGTREAVCTLLEGGERAFKEREGRYSIR